MYASTPSILAHAARDLAHRQQQPAPAAPSARSQQIFQRVVIHCQKQCDVAADLGVSPSRVSHIVARVRRWLAAGGQGDPETLSHLEQQRLERSLARARHEALYELSLRAATGGASASRPARASRPRTTKPCRVGPARAASAGPPKASSPTLNPELDTSNSAHSPPPINVQLLKTAQRSAIELQKLAELDPLPEPAAEKPTDYELFSALYDLLCDRRRHAESQGYVMPSKEVCHFI